MSIAGTKKDPRGELREDIESSKKKVRDVAKVYEGRPELFKRALTNKQEKELFRKLVNISKEDKTDKEYKKAIEDVLEKEVLSKIDEAYRKNVRFNIDDMLKDIQRVYEMFQDKEKAAKYLMSMGILTIEEVPPGGWKPYQVERAYQTKRRPRGEWEIDIDHDSREKMLRLGMVGPVDQMEARVEGKNISKSQWFREEFKKVADLLGLKVIGDIEDMRRPKISGNKFQVKLKAPVKEK